MQRDIQQRRRFKSRQARLQGTEEADQGEGDAAPEQGAERAAAGEPRGAEERQQARQGQPEKVGGGREEAASLQRRLRQDAGKSDPEEGAGRLGDQGEAKISCHYAEERAEVGEIVVAAEGRGARRGREGPRPRQEGGQEGGASQRGGGGAQE